MKICSRCEESQYQLKAVAIASMTSEVAASSPCQSCSYLDQLIQDSSVTKKVQWLVLKAECRRHDSTDEDQNPANEEDLNEACQAPEGDLEL